MDSVLSHFNRVSEFLDFQLYLLASRDEVTS